MDIPTIIISLFTVLFAITIHEASHGWAAYKMGDPTAHALGRVTLNPIAHIDPIGTILLPVILIVMGAPPFGWAKPVPVNPFNLRNPRRDNLLISAAGPISNFSVALIAFILLQVLKLANPDILIMRGGTPSLGNGLFLILYYTILINVILAVFNLIPIPPLDGSGVLMGLISEEAAAKYEQIRPYGFIILILLIMTGFIGRILGFIMGIVNIFIF
ncbi:site-2 protease family protein [Acidobacteriota bacterium]